jgi:hypothetical protein
MAVLLGVALAPGTPILPIIASTFWSMAPGPLASLGWQAVRPVAASSSQKQIP